MTFDELLNADLKSPVVALFYGAGCAPCERLKPVLREVCSAMGARLEEFNSAGEMAAVRALGMRSVPAVYIVFDGKPTFAFMGYLHAGAIKQRLATLGVKEG